MDSPAASSGGPAPEQFQTVKSKKKRKNKKYIYQEKTIQHYIPIYEECRRQLVTSRFYGSLRDNFEKIKSASPQIQSIRCLALGKPSASDRIAMWQLALLGLLVTYFDISWSNVSLWDPAFEAMDQEIISLVGGQVVEHSGPVNQHTFLYLPHAPVELIEEILTQCCSQCIILGNHVSRYDTTVLPQTLQDKYPTLHSVMNMIDGKAPNDHSWHIIDLPDSLSKGNDWSVAFNDLALHIKGHQK